ncbi:MAG TPA: LLM class F420-dependent oxidoreductase, partial [Actinotalea sp.]|nr:LLM class F420-dependent oxidoreductase [Actinotalea sp.]
RGAGWADGLVTVNQAPDALREVVGAYRDAGGTGTVALQVHVSWDPDPDRAAAVAHDQWRSNVFPPPLCWDLATPEQFDLASEHVSPAAVAEHSVLVESDPDRLADRLAELVAIGFDEVYLHQVSQEQEPFVTLSAERLLPALRERLAAVAVPTR